MNSFREQWLDVLRRMQPYGMDYIADINVFSGVDREALFRALSYLDAHGYIQNHCQQMMDNGWTWGGAQLTATGLDYLSEDGGLTAEEKIITVKLDEDTIKALMCSAVERSSAPDAEKTTLKQRIKSMGTAALKDLIPDLLSKGIESTPDLIQWLGTNLG